MEVPIERNPLGNSFTRVEYLKRTQGYPVFKTGVYPNSGLRWDVDIVLRYVGPGFSLGAKDTSSGSHYQILFATAGTTGIDGTGGYSYYIAFGTSSGTAVPPWRLVTGIRGSNRVLMTLDFPAMKWGIRRVDGGGTVYNESIPSGAELPQTAVPAEIQLGSFNLSNQTIYRSTIYSYGELVQDLVPALDPRGTPCLYDLVTKTPIYDSGTTPGAVEAGPVVSPPFS